MIAKQIEEQASDMHASEKLLLLGAGESGKSTVFKQMRLVHSSAYSERELNQFKYIIYRNILDAIKILVEQVNDMGLQLVEANEDLADQVSLWESESLNPEMAEIIAQLWADEGVQEAYRRRAEFQLGDNALYYLSQVQRIGSPDFVPTTDDALHARVRTSGAVSKEFQTKSSKFIVYDVGGQRAERRKWMPLFDHVSTIVFVAAISEYDQVVAEDRSKNRMQEALDLFKQIVNSDHFAEAEILLFLNKRDLFAEKIKSVDPQKWFPDYDGGCDYDAAEEYFKEAFRRRIQDPQKILYSYTTCATDTQNMAVVLKAIEMMAVEKLNSSLGLNS